MTKYLHLTFSKKLSLDKIVNPMTKSCKSIYSLYFYIFYDLSNLYWRYCFYCCLMSDILSSLKRSNNLSKKV